MIKKERIIIETGVKKIHSFLCLECNVIVYMCDSCSSYFEDDETVFCVDTKEHFCKTCESA